MELEFYGNEGWISPTDHHSCFSIKEEGTKILVDAGSPTIVHEGNMDIDAILLTHIHLDHIKNLYNLIGYMNVRNREEELPVYSPDNLNEHITKKVKPEIPADSGINYEFIEEPPERIGNLNIDHLKSRQLTPPPVDVYLYKIKNQDTTLTQVIDVELNEEIKKFCEGTDVLICDASQPNQPPIEGVHMTPNQVNELVNHVEPEKVILTHFDVVHPQEFKEKVNHDDITCAEEGLKIEI